MNAEGRAFRGEWPPPYYSTGRRLVTQAFRHPTSHLRGSKGRGEIGLQAVRGKAPILAWVEPSGARASKGQARRARCRPPPPYREPRQLRPTFEGRLGS